MNRTFYSTILVVLLASSTISFSTIAFSTAAFSKEQRLGTVEFKDADVGDAVRVISEMAQVNIVATEAAKTEKVSIYLKDTTVEGVIDGICRVSGLWYRRDKEHNIYYILTEDEFNREIVVQKDFITKIYELKHQNVSDAANAIESLYGDRVELTEPSENASYELEGDIGGGEGAGVGGNRNNATNRNNNNRNNRNNRVQIVGGNNARDQDAVEVRRDFFDGNQLNSGESVNISESQLIQSRVRQEPPIFVTWNYLHNLLLIRTSDASVISDINKLIKSIDRPAQQVLLEVKILRANLGQEERSIFDYAYQQGQIQTGQDGDGDPIFAPRRLLNLGNFPVEGGAFLAQLTGSELSATIEWLHTQNRINLVAQPNVISANNKEARLTIGEDRVIVTGATTDIITNESTTIVNIDLETDTRIIGTELSIWPRINDDKTVTLDIEQSSTTLNEGVTNLPVSSGLGTVTNVAIDSVTESTIELTAVARHGATIAVGGMIETETQEIKEKVPLLGDIPALGKLFRRDLDNDTRSELIVLITPWISENALTAHEVNQKRITQWTNNKDLNHHLETPETDKSEATPWPNALKTRAVGAIKYSAQRLQQLQTNSEIELPKCSTEFNFGQARFTDWKINEWVTVDAVGHCQNNDLYLTHAIVKNESNHIQQLRPILFNQGWIASSGESATLKPKEKATLFLVSSQPPEWILEKSSELFFYGEGSITH
ncbi:type II secretion system protein GspD [Sessilibacter corallicola]|uniref:type II secretion system protein GspD n=1 Tax=Sessilibacter corallicola TaxID=2904075 RepID=UPI001E2ABBC5|nr:hypothetical protein [Sessilibacter corallicola]MCE2029029.1 hypothetical protein [Sessilibacter corallicola]